MISAVRLRRAIRRETYGVEIAAALNLVGVLVLYISPAFLFPVAFAVGYDESAWPFVGAAAVTALAGIAIRLFTHGHERVGTREGFLVVSLVWLLIPAFGALPYLFSGDDQLANPLDAYFESMSGFSTTGSSVLTNIPALDHSLLMWRQFTQWLGGMGIIVLALAVLPRLRVGGRQLFETEAPGPEVESLTVTIREAARRFLLIYVGLTLLAVGTLLVIGWTGADDHMSPFDALAHALTSLPTGGFSPRARGMEEFGAVTQWAVIVILLFAGTNFALMYRAFVRGQPRVFGRDEEFRLYALILVAASVLMVIEVRGEELATGESAVRHAVFQVVSIGTTTGYASADFALWTPLASLILIGLMLIGASAGSTSGSIKVVRHVIIGKMLRRELDQTVHPEVVEPLRYNGRAVDERALRGVIVFVILYLGIAALGAVIVLAESAFGGIEVNAIESIAAAATTLGGVGPGLGVAGPMGSFDSYGDLSKGTLIALMFLGRIEIIPFVVLLTRMYWRA